MTPSPSASPSPGRAVEFRNISTRVVVRSGDDVGIAGFILRGEGVKRVIARGIGPSLQSDGAPLAGRLSDPRLELYDGNGLLIASNDNWRDAGERDAIAASGLAPEDDREAAILRDVSSGSNTAIIRGSDGATGIGLIEVYDLNEASGSDLANISTRAVVERSDNVLIGGFIVRGDIPQRMVIRAIGPALEDNGVSDALRDPTLQLRDADGTLIAENDNWKESQEAEIRATGLQPSRDEESAIVRELGAGLYTGVIRGKDDSSGTALVEVYNVRSP